MQKQTTAQGYEKNVLTGTLKLSYGVDYKAFEALKTCGLGENSANINGKKTSPWISTWLVQGGDLDLLLRDPSESESASLRGKLCNNLVLLGLNAGAADESELTPAWHFFHRRRHKVTKKIVEDQSERNLKEYLTECKLPFEGAYMTDILKFKDKGNDLYIEPDSGKVNFNKISPEVLEHNFELLKGELNLLRGNMPDDAKMLLMPLGGECETGLKMFIEGLSEQEKAWIAVPPTFMLHYAPPAWNDPRFQARREDMKKWCDEHIVK